MEFASIDLPTLFDPTTCVRKGLCPVTTPVTGSKHELYFEQHGKGDKYKIILIMGLNSSSFGWVKQVEWFGGGKAFQDEGGEGEKSTVLVFDNRGVGNSGYPSGPYTTSTMAEDVICLLDHVGWTKEREVHVVGISLGGMIAQELAWRIPERLGSLTLAVTTPGGWIWNNIPPWKGISSLMRLMTIPDPLKMAPVVMDMLFTQDWLEERNIDEPNRTNRQVQQEGYLRRVAITKKQRMLGHVSQMVAGLTHHVSGERLREIGERVGRVSIVVGDEDHLVWREGSVRLKAGMVDARLEEWTGTGHGIHAQRYREFNGLVERTVRGG